MNEEKNRCDVRESYPFHSDWSISNYVKNLAFHEVKYDHTYILLTECEGRTGRILAQGLGSMDRAASARYVQERPRADILPVRSRANPVNKRFIT